MLKHNRYHHGDLRETLIAAALRAILRDGVSSISLRQLAREAGVSHGAPAYHFGDRTGLFTAIATRGLELLQDRLLTAVREASTDPMVRLKAAGRAYVMFAAKNPDYFAIMFQPDLLNRDDAALVAARRGAYGVLKSAIAETRPLERNDPRTLDLHALRAWAQAHGLASLWLSGSLGRAVAPNGIDALIESVFSVAEAG